jgi:hypothetical protein
LLNIVGDVDSLHVEIDNLNDFLVGFYFIRSIDLSHLIRIHPIPTTTHNAFLHKLLMFHTCTSFTCKHVHIILHGNFKEKCGA